MSPEEIKISLSRQDIAALRKADDVCFYRRKGESYIRAMKRVTQAEKDKDPWADDKEHRISCGTDFHNYGNEFDSNDWNAFEMVHGAGVSRQWATIAGFLRPLDQLTLMWIANNNSQIIEEKQLHHDMLRLHVLRRTKGRHGSHGKTKNFVFHVSSSITPNNTARMIRHGRWKERVWARFFL